MSSLWLQDLLVVLFDACPDRENLLFVSKAFAKQFPFLDRYCFLGVLHPDSNPYGYPRLHRYPDSTFSLTMAKIKAESAPKKKVQSSNKSSTKDSPKAVQKKTSKIHDSSPKVDPAPGKPKSVPSKKTEVLPKSVEEQEDDAEKVKPKKVKQAKPIESSAGREDDSGVSQKKSKVVGMEGVSASTEATAESSSSKKKQKRKVKDLDETDTPTPKKIQKSPLSSAVLETVASGSTKTRGSKRDLKPAGSKKSSKSSKKEASSPAPEPEESDAQANNSEDGAEADFFGFSTDDDDDDSSDEEGIDTEIPGIELSKLPTIAKDDATVKRKLEKAKRNPVRPS